MTQDFPTLTIDDWRESHHRIADLYNQELVEKRRLTYELDRLKAKLRSEHEQLEGLRAELKRRRDRTYEEGVVFGLSRALRAVREEMDSYRDPEYLDLEDEE